MCEALCAAETSQAKPKSITSTFNGFCKRPAIIIFCVSDPHTQSFCSPETREILCNIIMRRSAVLVPLTLLNVLPGALLKSRSASGQLTYFEVSGEIKTSHDIKPERTAWWSDERGSIIKPLRAQTQLKAFLSLLWGCNKSINLSDMIISLTKAEVWLTTFAEFQSEQKGHRWWMIIDL